MNEYEVGARFNIAETCVDSVSPDALFALTGTDKAQFLSDFCAKRLTYGDIVGSGAGAGGGARRKGAGRHAVRQKNRKGGIRLSCFFLAECVVSPRWRGTRCPAPPGGAAGRSCSSG